MRNSSYLIIAVMLWLPVSVAPSFAQVPLTGHATGMQSAFETSVSEYGMPLYTHWQDSPGQWHKGNAKFGNIGSETLQALLIPDELPDWRQNELIWQWRQVENHLDFSGNDSSPSQE